MGERIRGLEAFRVGCQQDDGLCGRAGLDGCSEVAAGHGGHKEIRDHQVEFVRLKHRKRLFATGGDFNDVAFELQQHADGFANQRFIVHQQNMPFYRSPVSHCTTKSAIVGPEFPVEKDRPDAQISVGLGRAYA